MSRGSTALLTDRYELTMLRAALRSGAADRRTVFEVFARHLPTGRRYGILAGTGRVRDALERFRFGPDELEVLVATGAVDAATADWLAGYRFGGDVRAMAEGEPYMPDTPLLVVSGTFAECVLLETLVLSVLNHDSAIAAAAARMVCAAGGRPLTDMGSRRTHEEAAVAAARAAWIAGFAATSNLEAGRRYGLPTVGTSAHAFTLLYDSERDAFAAQVAALGPATTLLVDTWDVATAVRTAVDVAGPELGFVRLDSGDLGDLAVEVRAELDGLGARGTKIMVTSDLDEYLVAALGSAPVDAYGVGTALVGGSGAPTAGFVYKLVEVDGRPVEKASPGKRSRGGDKTVARRYGPDGVAAADVVSYAADAVAGPRDRPLHVDLVVKGEFTEAVPLAAAREHRRRRLAELPREALQLARGEPALPVIHPGDG